MQNSSFRLAIASGKGGTGKTTISVNLAVLLSKRQECTYADLDVEEPNGHIFLKPSNLQTFTEYIDVPQVDTLKCTGCKLCTDFCQYSVLAYTGQKVMIFEELCHSCGGCFLVCPQSAILRKKKQIGTVSSAQVSPSLSFLQGTLDTDGILSPTLINRVKNQIKKDTLVILDAPPGTSCSAMAAVEDVDHVILVVEPTPFGENDFHLMEEALQKRKISYSVIINKKDGPENITSYCEENNIPVLGSLSHSLDIAKKISRGELIYETNQLASKELETIVKNIEVMVKK